MTFGMVKSWSKECLASDGAIFLCNHLTRKECFEKKIFGLSPSYTEFVEKVKAGTTLFLFDIDQHKLHGGFEATSDGALDIIPDAYISAGHRLPYQAQILCDLLMSPEGCGSKSDTSAGGTSDKQVTDLLGTNSESRTSFVNHSTPALCSKNVETYAEQSTPYSKHDPGEAATPV